MSRGQQAPGISFSLLYRAGNLVDAHHVLGITVKRLAVPFAAISRIDAPVNEASELCFAPPGDPLVVGFHRSLPPAVHGIVDGFLIARLAGFGVRRLLLTADRNDRRKNNESDRH